MQNGKTISIIDRDLDRARQEAAAEIEHFKRIAMASFDALAQEVLALRADVDAMKCGVPID